MVNWRIRVGVIVNITTLVNRHQMDMSMGNVGADNARAITAAGALITSARPACST